MFERYRQELKQYYDSVGFVKEVIRKYEAGEPVPMLQKRDAVFAEMDEYYAAHPDLPPIRLKGHLYTVIARHFEPVIFRGSPFFFEMGLRERGSWGMSEMDLASSWCRSRIMEKVKGEHPIVTDLEARFMPLYDMDLHWKEESGVGLCNIPFSFDEDHHTLGYTQLLQIGFGGVLEQVRRRKEAAPEGSEAWHFCCAAEEGCLALFTIAGKFADRAAELLAAETDSQCRRYLELLEAAARKLPARPPETFYEALAFLLFVREAVASLENIGISQLGHLDRLLGGLYAQDLAAGRMTEAEARELLGLWMLFTDVKFDMEHNEWPETSTCIQLGGCDADGNPVYNEVTRLVIEEHHRLGLVNPKLNCRYSKQSPDEYLQVVGKAILAGHNNFVMINDDIVISGLERNGVATEDARLYVSGGCQETMIEGCGHTEGAALYVSVPRILDLFLHDDRNTGFFRPLAEYDAFEAFYDGFLAALRNFFNLMTDQRNVRQHYNKEYRICPLFSATQKGCIETGRDYVHGGARYNFSTIALVGLGTTADSLYAIRELVFERKRLTLPELVGILLKNWEGNELLRQEALALPKYACGQQEADDLANRFLTDVTDHIRSRENERGGNYIPSLFVYYYFQYFSDRLRATADGRRNGDLISPGCGPSQLRKMTDATAPLRSMGHVDFTSCGGGSAVLDLKLPASGGMDEKLFAGFLRACFQCGCPTLQPNVISQEDLLDARVHPEKHKNLIVRISGLSAYFVALTPEVQDEIIARNVYRA